MSSFVTLACSAMQLCEAAEAYISTLRAPDLATCISRGDTVWLSQGIMSRRSKDKRSRPVPNTVRARIRVLRLLDKCFAHKQDNPEFCRIFMWRYNHAPQLHRYNHAPQFQLIFNYFSSRVHQSPGSCPGCAGVRNCVCWRVVVCACSGHPEVNHSVVDYMRTYPA